MVQRCLVRAGQKTKRVGFVVTFRLAGGRKLTLKVVDSSRGYEYLHVPDVWANARLGMGTQV